MVLVQASKKWFIQLSKANFLFSKVNIFFIKNLLSLFKSEINFLKSIFQLISHLNIKFESSKTIKLLYTFISLAETKKFVYQ